MTEPHSKPNSDRSSSHPRRPLAEIWRLDRHEMAIPEDLAILAANRGRLFPEIATRRIVLTGPPSSGKTTNTEFLSAAGLPTLPEAARLVLGRATGAGYSVGEIFDPAHLEARQTKIFLNGFVRELKENPDHIKIMDRSFLDAIPFSQALGMDVSSWLRYGEFIRYERIIYLEPLPVLGDSERPADPGFVEMYKRIDQLSRNFWHGLGYSPTYIPALDSSGATISIATRLGLVARALGFTPEMMHNPSPKLR